MALFYGSISFDQLSGYIAFCILLIWGAKYRHGTKYNVARKLAKSNAAIIYAKAWGIYPILYLALLFLNCLEDTGGSTRAPAFMNGNFGYCISLN